MSNDNKTLADVQPGGRVRLGDQAERARFEDCGLTEGLPLARGKFGGYAFEVTAKAWLAWQYLSAQPSPGGQDALDCIGRIEEAIEFRVPHDIYAAVHGELAELKAALAARQPVGELHLPPDGFYKIVFDDAEVPDESFARSGALDAALRRFEQISNKWNAHLFVRFANNTRDCTAPNATPAQAVDLGQFRAQVAELLRREFDLEVADPDDHRHDDGAGEADRIAGTIAALIDSQAVGNG